MRKVNYNDISRVYDDVRQAEEALINCFLLEVPVNPEVKILDIGCGTGNHADLLQKISGAQVFGIEPSEGMLEKALQKDSRVVFKQGSAQEIPFEADFFDFIFMTDVIHHVPDIVRMFAEIWRVLKPGGKVCIMTQSYRQIEKRPIVRFFPSTALVDRQRYPDIGRISGAAQSQRLKPLKNTTLHEGAPVDLDSNYLELVRKKGYSMLHLIPEEEYQAGLKKLESEMAGGVIRASQAGETLVWLEK